MTSSRDEFNLILQELQAFAAQQENQAKSKLFTGPQWIFPSLPNKASDKLAINALAEIEKKIMNVMHGLVAAKKEVQDNKRTYIEWCDYVKISGDAIYSLRLAFEASLKELLPLEKLIDASPSLESVTEKKSTPSRKANTQNKPVTTSPNVSKPLNLSPTENNMAMLKIYDDLIALTNHYVITHKNMNHDAIASEKCRIFKSLRYTLIMTPGPISKRLTVFKKELEKADQAPVNRTHRTDTWKRYLYNALSCLTLIPALGRAISSYSKYHTIQFWKPESQKILAYASQKTKNALKR